LFTDTSINTQQQTLQGPVEFPEGDAFLDFDSPAFDQAEFRELYDGPKSEDEVFGSPSKPVVFKIKSGGQGDVNHFVIRNPGADFLDPLFARYTDMEYQLYDVKQLTYAIKILSSVNNSLNSQLESCIKICNIVGVCPRQQNCTWRRDAPPGQRVLRVNR
jgi:hypothetical protein